MRLDAAKLTKCFGSCFPLEAVTRSPRCSTTKVFRRTRLSAGFSFLGTTLLRSGGKDPALNVKNFNKYAIIRDKTPKALFQPVIPDLRFSPLRVNDSDPTPYQTPAQARA